MLEEAQTPSRSQHAPQLVERAAGIGDRAQGEGRHRGVDRGGGDGEALGVAPDVLDAQVGRADPGGGEASRDRRRLDREDNVHLGRVAAEVEAGPEADLDDAAAQAGERLPPEPSEPLAAEQEMGRARDDLGAPTPLGGILAVRGPLGSASGDP